MLSHAHRLWRRPPIHFLKQGGASLVLGRCPERGRWLFTSPCMRTPQLPGPAPPAISFRARLLVSVAIGGAAVVAWSYFQWEKDKKRKLDRIRQLQNMAVGQGDFSLLDQDGRPCSKKDLRGSWVLLYFGFTHCPDICPEELQKLCSAVSLLEKEPGLPPVLPVFVTVDPLRDDVPAVAKYVRDFHPRLKGLTGTPEQVKAAAQAYRVYYSAGAPDEDDDYIVDHTVIVYLLNPDGLFTDYYNRTKDDRQIAESVKKHMMEYKSIFS